MAAVQISVLKKTYSFWISGVSSLSFYPSSPWSAFEPPLLHLSHVAVLVRKAPLLVELKGVTKIPSTGLQVWHGIYHLLFTANSLRKQSYEEDSINLAFSTNNGSELLGTAILAVQMLVHTCQKGNCTVLPAHALCHNQLEWTCGHSGFQSCNCA